MSQSEHPKAHCSRVLGTVLLCLVIAYAIAMALQFVVLPLDPFDESITILGGRAVVAGMTPHADFWTDYPALTYWAIAGASWLFGESYLVARCLSLVLYLAVIVTAWNVAPNCRSRIIVTAALILAIGSFFTYTPWNAFALVLIALLLHCYKRRDTSSAFWLLMGFLIACTLLIRINFAAYAFIAIASSLALGTKLDSRTKTIKLVWLSAPVVLAAIFYCVVFGKYLPAVYSQLIDFPSHILMRERILHIRFLAVGLLVIPFLMVLQKMRSRSKHCVGWLGLLGALTVVTAIDLYHRHNIPRPTYALGFALLWIVLQAVFKKLGDAEFTVILCYLLFLHYYLARADIFHLWPALILLAMMIALMTARKPVGIGEKVDVGIVAATLLLGIFLYPAYDLVLPRSWLFSRYTLGRLTAYGQQNLKMQLGLPQDGEAEAIAYLMVRTTPSDYVYSGLLDHSHGYTNNLRSYVVMKRQIPVSDWEYEPGYSSEAPSQEKAVSELERTRTNWLLLWRGERSANQIDRPIHGSSRLDAYIRSKFCVIQRFGDYEVWQRCRPPA